MITHQQITEHILLKSDADYLSPSRVHPLASFSNDSSQVYVKREDETGFGVSGCKKRKYASLIPFLLKAAYKQVVLIGGAHSNHISAVLQLLNEHRMSAHLFLKQAHQQQLSGNALLRYLLADPKQIHWLTSDEWKRVVPLAEDFAQQQSLPTFVIPEGGSCEAAFPGACSLMLDTVRNEETLGFEFDHIFIDSGTALIAAALVGMNSLLQRNTHIHVILTAGDEAYFHHQLTRHRQWFYNLFQQDLSVFSPFSLYPPSTARSFGSVNRTVLNECLRLAREEGVLVDPIYTAKLFYSARQQIYQQKLSGNILIIHSGGGTGLMGFGERFMS